MSATTAEQDVNGPEPDLKRVMGPGLLLLFIVGDILGAGVYAVTGRIAGQVGGRTVIKEEQMPDGRRKLILKDESTGAFSDVVV